MLNTSLDKRPYNANNSNPALAIDKFTISSAYNEIVLLSKSGIEYRLPLKTRDLSSQLKRTSLADNAGAIRHYVYGNIGVIILDGIGTTRAPSGSAWESLITGFALPAQTSYWKKISWKNTNDVYKVSLSTTGAFQIMSTGSTATLLIEETFVYMLDA